MFIAKFMSLIAGTPKFDFVLDFLEDDDRGKIKSVIEGLDQIKETEEYKNLLKMYETV